MTINLKHTEREHELEISGTWDEQDAVELKKTLQSIPADTRKLGILATGLDDLPMAGVQVVLAYIRYARSIPRPVHIYYNKKLQASMGLWGLDHSGWENFFHGR